MEDVPVEKSEAKSASVYRFSTAEILAACALCLGFFNRGTDGGRDLQNKIDSAKQELRDEYRSADAQLRIDIGKSEERSTKTSQEAEIRFAGHLRANEARDSKRFETIEFQLLQLAKGKR